MRSMRARESMHVWVSGTCDEEEKEFYHESTFQESGKPKRWTIEVHVRQSIDLFLKGRKFGNKNLEFSSPQQASESRRDSSNSPGVNKFFGLWAFERDDGGRNCAHVTIVAAFPLIFAHARGTEWNIQPSTCHEEGISPALKIGSKSLFSATTDEPSDGCK